MEPKIDCYVITHKTKDFGDKYVVRITEVCQGKLTVRPDTVAVVDTLLEARAAIPPNLTHFPRVRADDPVVVETWM